MDPDDRVAIVLPNGPAMASAFACMAPWCATAPLNPAYKADEFDFYLKDLAASALVVDAGSASPAVDVATSAWGAGAADRRVGRGGVVPP